MPPAVPGRAPAEREPQPPARREAGGSCRDAPSPSTASGFIELQRLVGNRAVGRLLGRSGDAGVLQRSIFDTLAEVVETVVDAVADPIGTAERVMGIGDRETVTDPVA